MKILRARTLCLLALLAVIMLQLHCLAFDVEVEVEEEPEEDEPQAGGSGQSSQSHGSKTTYQSSIQAGWDSAELAKRGINLLTNQDFDEKIYTPRKSEDESLKPWLIVFVANVGRDSPGTNRFELARIMFELLLDFSKMPEAKKTNVAFVDTFLGGELLNETFDIEVVPSVRLVRGDQVYHLKLPKDG